jgi:3',5'-cyclic-AMP phosphodiesterase
MPIHLPPHDRRCFLATVGAGFVAYSTPASGWESDVDESLVYFLNDTHIGEKQPPDSPVPRHLRQVVQELLGLPRKPSCVIINGDLALKDGQPGDYRRFADLIDPLVRAGISLHLTLGNHDNREAFYEVFEEARPDDPPVEARHISIVETRFANLFLLDSLTETMVTPGTLGDRQRNWLAGALDHRAGKPAVIVAHHNPRLGGDPLHFPGGLVDSSELWALLAGQKHVKAYIHGHIHDRSFARHQDIHIINTPATSYVANPMTSTTGWTTAELGPGGATLTTRTSDEQHPWNRQRNLLTWRPS